MISPKVGIRPILPGDGAAVAGIIRQVLTEFGVPREGSAFSDPSMEGLYRYFQAPRSAYWVLSDGDAVWGGEESPPYFRGTPAFVNCKKCISKRK